jgi:hypothetical protein
MITMKNHLQKLRLMSVCTLMGIFLLTNSVVMGQDLNNGLKLHYTFDPATVSGTTVQDVTGDGYNGTLYTATVGVSNGKNALILGTTGTAYLDMGANTGSLVASLTDFSMSCYVWVNTTYATLGNDGNMIATFSNSQNSGTDKNGYMYIQAKRTRYGITTGYYDAEQAVQAGANMVQGQWVQFTYTQSGTTGNLYIDGVLKNTNTNVTLTPSSLGATPYNMIAKSCYAGDINLQDAQIADFRIYNRALTHDEILMLNGYSSNIISAYNSLTLGDISAVQSDLTLPSASGTIPVTWTSSLPAVIGTNGKVNRPTQYDATVKLTATLTDSVNGVTYTLTKDFLATVKAFNVVGDQLAQWDFATNRISEKNGSVQVTDSISGFVGTLMNDASIRTIGNTQQFNVLDLGNGQGYMDLGTEIGKAIYSLNDYTMCAYFRVDNSNTDLNNNGNFIWDFSNTDNAPVDMNGYIFGSLKATGQTVSTNYWAIGNQSINANVNATKGGWHHLAYVQSGTTGTVYVDGVSVATGSMTNLPSTSITIAGRTGTLYNWLGRSCYPGDAYLKNTLIYDFQLFRVALTSDDLNFGFNVPATIDALNFAYQENPKVQLPELATEANNLTLGDLSAVTSNITLPVKGVLDSTISIVWKSSDEQLISSNGVVTRPDFYNYSDSLYATLTKNGQKVFKAFGATVIAKPGTAFTGDNLVKFDFSTVADSVVTDAAEKHFTGILKNDAHVITIGTTDTGTYNVLSLGDSIGYFDMGQNVGKIMYNLTNFTIGAYYRIDASYTGLGSNGNFLWNFSNSNDILSNPGGYLIASLRNQAATITPNNWTTEQTVTFASLALTDGWHHMAYTQNDSIGTLYVDGLPVATGTVNQLPANTLNKLSSLGTLYNWIGRSCYKADVYLRKSLVYDFRIYNHALTNEQIQTSVLNVGATIGKLDAAYSAASALKDIFKSNYKITSDNHRISISGLSGNENVAIFDLTGQQMKMNQNSSLRLDTGIYLVKVNDYIDKVFVK